MESSCKSKQPRMAVNSPRGRINQKKVHHTYSVLFPTTSPSSAYWQSIFANTPFSQSAMANLSHQSKYITIQFTSCICTARITTSEKFGHTSGSIGTPLTNGGSGCDQHILMPSHGSVQRW